MLSIQPYKTQENHYSRNFGAAYRYNGRRHIPHNLNKDLPKTKKTNYDGLYITLMVLVTLAMGCHIYAAYCRYMGNKAQEEYIKTLEAAVDKSTNNTYLYE